jgi:nitronate monooxygenase
MPLRTTAEAAGSGEFTALWTGQAGSLGREMPAGELTTRLAEEALDCLKFISGNGGAEASRH